MCVTNSQVAALLKLNGEMLPSHSRILAEAIYFDIFANTSFFPIHLRT